MSFRPLALMLVAALVFALGLLVGHANGGLVHFDYLVGAIDASLMVVLAIAFAAGVLLTLAVVVLRLLGLRNELKRIRRQLRNAEAELRSLRNLPAP